MSRIISFRAFLLLLIIEVIVVSAQHWDNAQSQNPDDNRRYQGSDKLFDAESTSYTNGKQNCENVSKEKFGRLISVDEDSRKASDSFHAGSAYERDKENVSVSSENRSMKFE